MQKRRERIERWRAERKKTETEGKGQKTTSGSSLTVPQTTSKKWSLEDDSEDEDKAIEKSSEKEECSVDSEKKVVECGSEVIKEEVDDDVDPLDEYMKSCFCSICSDNVSFILFF